jgi:glycosyltransferase involved in cell wall biosynthesis
MINLTEKDITKNWQTHQSKPTVSICTITYNHEAFIEEALDSFLMQETDFAFEIVVDDDFSSDGTIDILQSYATKFPNLIKLNLRKNNVGSMLNFIENLQRANAQYIAICEGDDYWTDKHKLQLQYNAMQENSQVALSFHSATELIDGVKGKILADYKKNQIFQTSKLILKDGGFCPTASLMIKKKFVEKIPIWFYDAPVGDYFLQVLASMDGGALYIDKNMCIYRKNSSNLSWSAEQKKDIKRVEFFRKMLHSLIDMDKYLQHQYKKEIAFAQQRYINKLLKKTSLPLALRKDIYNEYSDSLSIRYKIKWYVRYYKGVLSLK